METKKKSAANAAHTCSSHKMGADAHKKSSTTSRAGSTASKAKSNAAKKPADKNRDDNYDYYVVESFEITEY